MRPDSSLRGIYLLPNLHPLDVPVRLIDGAETTLNINKGEGWFNEYGVLHFWAHVYSNGQVGNFKLIREFNEYSAYKTAWNNKISDFIKQFLRNHGTDLVFDQYERKNKISDGNRDIYNLGKYLAQQFSYVVIDKAFVVIDDAVSNDWNYYYQEITDGEKIINYPIQLKVGPETRQRFENIYRQIGL